MANTAVLVGGPSGQSGPNAVGEYAEEIWKITGDNTSAAITITPAWLRQIDHALGSIVNSVITNTASPPTIAITFPANLGAGAITYVAVRGRR